MACSIFSSFAKLSTRKSAVIVSSFPSFSRGYFITNCKIQESILWAKAIRGGPRSEFSANFCHSTSSGASSSNDNVCTDDGSVVVHGGRDYLTMSDEKLMRQCSMDTLKSSGPGGQHRNKRESAVRLKHLPTGIIAQAAEDRSQHRNRASALSRLRTLIALKGIQLSLTHTHLLKSFFRYSLQSQPSRDRMLGLKLDQIIQNLFWECKLYST